MDFAGPIAYQTKGNKVGKAYIILFTSSLTRAFYLELLPNQTMEEFIRSMKRLITRRGRPEKIYLDNGKTFVWWWLGPKWLAKREQWPDEIETIPTSETEKEAKLVRDALAIAVKFDDNLDQLMVNHTFWKAVRILSWVAWFLHNCRHKPKQHLSGPLKTEEIDEQIGVWVK